MAQSIKMPALGESVSEGTVTAWLKKVGDTVEADEPIVEVATDKVDSEVPSPIAGVLLEILVDEDETVEVGTEIARVGAADEAAQAAPAAPAPTEAPAAAQAAAAPDAPAPASPAPAEVPAPMPASAPAEGAPAGNLTDVVMPALGESVSEGTVTSWLVSIGDQVSADDPVVEVATDKVDSEVPSPADGYLAEILVAEDDTVEVGTVLARISDSAPGAAAPASATAARQPEAPAAPAAPPVQAPPAPVGTPAPAQTPPTFTPPAPVQAPPPPAPVGTPAPAPVQAPPPPAPVGTPAPAPVQAPPAPPQPAPVQAPPAPVGTPAPEVVQVPSIPEAPESPAQQQVLDAVARATNEGTEVAPPPSLPASAGYVTPLVRKLAREKGVDLTTVTGTGIGGRIRREDVETAAAAAAAPAPTPAAPAAPAPVSDGRIQVSEEAAALRGTTQKMSRLRQTVARRMVESLQTAAQLTTVFEVDVTKVAALRAKYKDQFQQVHGTKLTFLPFFVKAATEALQAHPKLNAVINDREVTYHAQENIGIAVDAPQGLMVVVIKDAGDLSIAGIAEAINSLALKAREGKISPDELTGSTFTVTNTGSGGALFDTPVLNMPETGIMGVGTIVKRPMVVRDVEGGEGVAIRSMVYLSITYDHRLVDGADASRFLSDIKRRLEAGEFLSDLQLG